MTAQYTQDAIEAPHTLRELEQAAADSAQYAETATERAEKVGLVIKTTTGSPEGKTHATGDLVSREAALAEIERVLPRCGKFTDADRGRVQMLEHMRAFIGGLPPFTPKTDLARVQAKEDANWTTAKDYWKDRAEKAEAEVERLKSQPDAAGGDPVTLTYRNYRGEVAERTITPRCVWFGSTDWHPEPQWLLAAFDHEKQADRDFALKDFGRATAKPLLDLADKIEAEEREAASWDGPDPRGPLAMGYAFTFIKRLRAEARVLAALQGGAP